MFGERPYCLLQVRRTDAILISVGANAAAFGSMLEQLFTKAIEMCGSDLQKIGLAGAASMRNSQYCAWTAARRRLRSLAVLIDVGGLSHPGKVRSRNEDHFIVTRIGRYLETMLTNIATRGRTLSGQRKSATE